MFTAEIDNLQLATALWSVGELQACQLPSVAINLLEAGLDSHELRMLAGLSSDDTEQAVQLFQTVLDVAGYGMMPLVQGVRIYTDSLQRKSFLESLSHIEVPE